jgi:adenine-specific DNA-methyltransferase
MDDENKNIEEPDRFDLRSEDIAEDRREELSRIFPEVLTEGGKIDFDKLKLALGADVDVGKERYGLTWPGKAECFKTLQAPSMGTLRPCPEESVNWDSTENLIIEGDNLEVLKLLQKSYLGKVKMIYIDPPYNTGNDFIYPDNYTESLQTYLKYTGQADAEGKKFSTNTDADGRFHSRWLSMMYPRLYLARNLLREDGVIFISIDDNEIHNLRRLCDEVFGEESFVGSVVVKMSHLSGMKMAHKDVKLPKLKEHLLAYARDRDAFSINPLYVACSWDEAFSRYTSWLDFDDRADVSTWKRRPLGDVVEQEAPSDVDRFLVDHADRVFRTAVNDSLAGTLKDGVFRETTTPTGLKRIALNGEEVIFAETKIRNIDGKRTPTQGLGDIWTDIGINNLHKEGGVQFPNGKKPMKLLRRLIELATSGKGHELIVDFFAGSGTTGHATLEANRADDGDRRFSLVQLPEPIDDEAGETVADLTKERLRQAVREVEGFRAFKLDESCFTTWDSRAGEEVEDFEKQLELHVDHVREGRSDEDLLFELLLKSGFTLEPRSRSWPSAMTRSTASKTAC